VIEPSIRARASGVGSQRDNGDDLHAGIGGGFVSVGSDDDGRLAGDSSCGEVANRIGKMFKSTFRPMTGTTAPLARWSVSRWRIVWCA
jgi:hypothetical protein